METYDQQPVSSAPAPAVRSKNGMGTAGFVLSLLALVLCWVPIANIILFFLGLIFSIVGVCLKNRKKGLAIAGLSICIVLIIAIVIAILALGEAGLFDNAFDALDF